MNYMLILVDSNNKGKKHTQPKKPFFFFFFFVQKRYEISQLGQLLMLSGTQSPYRPMQTLSKHLLEKQQAMAALPHLWGGTKSLCSHPQCHSYSLFVPKLALDDLKGCNHLPVAKLMSVDAPDERNFTSVSFLPQMRRGGEEGRRGGEE